MRRVVHETHGRGLSAGDGAARKRGRCHPTQAGRRPARPQVCSRRLGRSAHRYPRFLVEGDATEPSGCKTGRQVTSTAKWRRDGGVRGCGASFRALDVHALARVAKREARTCQPARSSYRKGPKRRGKGLTATLTYYGARASGARQTNKHTVHAGGAGPGGSSCAGSGHWQAARVGPGAILQDRGRSRKRKLHKILPARLDSSSRPPGRQRHDTCLWRATKTRRNSG